jgi:hypothetical protein
MSRQALPAAPRRSCRTLCRTAMSGSRQHSSKTVVVSYDGGATREVWDLRFNRGGKTNKPVKFFADLRWKRGAGGVAYSGTRADFASEIAAEAWFAASVAESGGEISDATPQVLKQLEGPSAGAT